MLDDDGMGAHLDHEAAGFLDAGAGDKKLIAAMEQDDKVIELVAVSGDVADEIDEIERIGTGAVFGGDGELMFSDGENANPHATQVPDEDAASGVEVRAGADRLDAGPGADRKGIRQVGGAVVEDVVIGQVEDIDAGLFNAIDTRSRFAKGGPGFLNGRLLLDQRAFQIGDAQAGLLKLREQVVQQGANIALQEIGLIALNGADIRNDD